MAAQTETMATLYLDQEVESERALFAMLSPAMNAKVSLTRLPMSRCATGEGISRQGSLEAVVEDQGSEEEWFLSTRSWQEDDEEDEESEEEESQEMAVTARRLVWSEDDDDDDEECFKGYPMWSYTGPTIEEMTGEASRLGATA